MFVGHFAIGLAAKKFEPRVSLGTYFLSAQLLDLLWPAFLLLGIEAVRVDPGNTVWTPLDFHHYPYSHSLVAALGWSAGAFALARAVYRDSRVAAILAACVYSHWLLDFLMHRPDLPILSSDGPKLGLSLWNSVPATIVIELGMYALAIALYLKATRARNWIGSYALCALLLSLAGIWIGGYLGPPPPGEREVAIVSNLQWLFVAWGYWVDRNRSPVRELA